MFHPLRQVKQIVYKCHRTKLNVANCCKIHKYNLFHIHDALCDKTLGNRCHYRRHPLKTIRRPPHRIVRSPAVTAWQYLEQVHLKPYRFLLTPHTLLSSLKLYRIPRQNLEFCNLKYIIMRIFNITLKLFDAVFFGNLLALSGCGRIQKGSYVLCELTSWTQCATLITDCTDVLP